MTNYTAWMTTMMKRASFGSRHFGAPASADMQRMSHELELMAQDDKAHLVRRRHGLHRSESHADQIGMADRYHPQLSAR